LIFSLFLYAARIIIPLNKRAASNLLIETVHTAKIVSSKYSYDLVETRSWIYVIKTQLLIFRILNYEETVLLISVLFLSDLNMFWFLINTLFWKVIIMKMMLSRNIPLIQRTRPNNRTVFHLLMKSAITRTIVCFAYSLIQKYSMNYAFTCSALKQLIKCSVSQFGKWQKNLIYTQTKALELSSIC
jgi:hypothetical protein